MDKKAAEQQAQAAKEATGRAMFEKGDWEASGDEDSEGEEDEEEDAWNMEKLRQETEALREAKEAERVAKFGGAPVTNGNNTQEVPEPDPTEGDGNGEAS